MMTQDRSKANSKEGPKSILKKNSQFDHNPEGEVESFSRVKPRKSIRFSLVDLHRNSGNLQTLKNTPLGAKGNASEKARGKKEGNKRQKNTNGDPEKGTRPITRKKNLRNKCDGGDGGDSSIMQNSRPGSKERDEKKKTELWGKYEGAEENSSLVSSGDKVLNNSRGENEEETSPLLNESKLEATKEEWKDKDYCQEESEKREGKKKRKRRRKRKRKSNTE